MECSCQIIPTEGSACLEENGTVEMASYEIYGKWDS